MEGTQTTQQEGWPLVEPAPAEAVLPALLQSAHPVEFLEANPSSDEAAESDGS